MKPVFWFVAGAGTTLYGAIKIRRATEILTQDGAKDRWQAISHGAATFAHDVRDAHHIRRHELRQRYGMPALASQKNPELERASDGD
ncbi:hypothetical protein Back2_06010 [Nocardioides baekrokdamisoli]|uniref:Uncharacterized protein n=1 Tax=Nocardioides baekrokdamisoli TaxID=1804624 RepID=A0A3G9IYP9_9ACTN|nr:DUF6167 family protein [Nocardioides baekrokdamisoli]BBH16314.1 hypothetical protein Back2_06010 [Nocardioides baekrokdamisoli]